MMMIGWLKHMGIIVYNLVKCKKIKIRNGKK
jgi:hypothetical protein